MVRTCKIRACDEPRKLMKSPLTGEHLESLYCKKHACHSNNEAYNPTFVLCENPAKKHSRYCAYHPKCKVIGCSEPRQYEDDRFGRFFCVRHTCIEPKCGNNATGYDNRCEFHKLCAHSGCNHFRAKARDGWLPVCQNHIIRKCYSHACQSPAKGNSAFCHNHKCLIEACSYQKAPGSDYCAAHTCNIKDCFYPIGHPTAIVPGKPRDCMYCKEHECRLGSCHNFANVRGGCCKPHGCSVKDCREPISSESKAGSYCFDHFTRKFGKSFEKIGRLKEQDEMREKLRQEEEERREQEIQDRIKRQHQETLDYFKARALAAEEEREAEKKAKEAAQKIAAELARLEKERQEAEDRRRETEELERKIEERERERRRRSYDSSTEDSASLVDHPPMANYSIPAYNDKYTPRSVFIPPKTDHVYDSYPTSPQRVYVLDQDPDYEVHDLYQDSGDEDPVYYYQYEEERPTRRVRHISRRYRSH